MGISRGRRDFLKVSGAKVLARLLLGGFSCRLFLLPLRRPPQADIYETLQQWREGVLAQTGDEMKAAVEQIRAKYQQRGWA